MGIIPNEVDDFYGALKKSTFNFNLLWWFYQNHYDKVIDEFQSNFINFRLGYVQNNNSFIYRLTTFYLMLVGNNEKEMILDLIKIVFKLEYEFYLKQKRKFGEFTFFDLSSKSWIFKNGKFIINIIKVMTINDKNYEVTFEFGAPTYGNQKTCFLNEVYSHEYEIDKNASNQHLNQTTNSNDDDNDDHDYDPLLIPPDVSHVAGGGNTILPFDSSNTSKNVSFGLNNDTYSEEDVHSDNDEVSITEAQDDDEISGTEEQDNDGVLDTEDDSGLNNENDEDINQNDLSRTIRHKDASNKGGQCLIRDSNVTEHYDADSDNSYQNESDLDTAIFLNWKTKLQDGKIPINHLKIILSYKKEKATCPKGRKRFTEAINLIKTTFNLQNKEDKRTIDAIQMIKELDLLKQFEINEE